MGNCVLTSGIALECLDNIGGIKSAVIGAYSDATTFTYDVDGSIATITSSESFYSFKFRPQTAGFTEELTKSLENGTMFWTQLVTMMFHKMDAAKRNTIALLASASIQVIVETQNGQYFIIGLANGANTSAVTSGAGTAYGDKNGYDITIQGLEPASAHLVSQAAYDSLTIV